MCCPCCTSCNVQVKVEDRKFYTDRLCLRCGKMYCEDTHSKFQQYHELICTQCGVKNLTQYYMAHQPGFTDGVMYACRACNSHEQSSVCVEYWKYHDNAEYYNP